MSAISGISDFFPIYAANPVNPVSGADKVTRGTEGIEKTQPTECQTCKNRKYVDVSNEGNVSFQAPTHIDPGSSAAQVMGHEQEHVANAKAEGSKEGKELISANVALHVSICPECGRSYVSGGTTTTTIATSTPSSNPYEQAFQSMAGNLLAGSYVDATA